MKRILFILLLLPMFVVQTVSAQGWQWAKSARDSSGNWTNSVTTDIAGNIYIVGGTTGSHITFDNTTLTNAGGWDIFLVKYDANRKRSF